MKHTVYALEAILQNELKSIIAEECKERGCSNIETHAYTQGYLRAVGRMKEIILQQKAHPYKSAPQAKTISEASTYL